MPTTIQEITVYAPVFENETFDPIGQRIQEYGLNQPDKVALYDQGRSITWRELVDQVNAIANRLRACGLQVGDKVAGLSENSAEYVALYLGTLAAGGCMVPLSGMASEETLELMINDCDARFLFVSARNRKLVEGFRRRLPNIGSQAQIALDFEDWDWRSLHDWIGDASREFTPVALRSEERRVGKGWRAGWAAWAGTQKREQIRVG